MTRAPTLGHRSVPIALLVAALAGSCGPSAAPEAPVIRPVRWLEVSAAEPTRLRTFSGTARAGLESRLSFRVPGTVERVDVGVGQTVAKGAEIARLDATDAELRERQAQASLDLAIAARRKAEADYERVRGLYENDGAAKSDLDAARAQAESTRSQVEAAQQALALVRRELAYTCLRAPVGGAIARLSVEAGENVQPGQVVALLTSGSRAEVEIGMPEALIGLVAVGAPVEVRFDAVADSTFAATVTEVGVAATGSTYPVTVQLDAEDPGVRSGMAATVGFRLAERAPGERLLLPPVAVGEDREGRYVFVLEPADGELFKARRRAVTVGELTPDGIEVSGGLELGERIVTAGLRRILDGQTVRLLAP